MLDPTELLLKIWKISICKIISAKTPDFFKKSGFYHAYTKLDKFYYSIVMDNPLEFL